MKISELFAEITRSGLGGGAEDVGFLVRGEITKYINLLGKYDHGYYEVTTTVDHMAEVSGYYLVGKQLVVELDLKGESND